MNKEKLLQRFVAFLNNKGYSIVSVGALDTEETVQKRTNKLIDQYFKEGNP